MIVHWPRIQWWRSITSASKTHITTNQNISHARPTTRKGKAIHTANVHVHTSVDGIRLYQSAFLHDVGSASSPNGYTSRPSTRTQNICRDAVPEESFSRITEREGPALLWERLVVALVRGRAAMFSWWWRVLLARTGGEGYVWWGRG